MTILCELCLFCAVVVKIERLKLFTGEPQKIMLFHGAFRSRKYCMDQLFNGYGGA